MGLIRRTLTQPRTYVFIHVFTGLFLCPATGVIPLEWEHCLRQNVNIPVHCLASLTCILVAIKAQVQAKICLQVNSCYPLIYTNTFMRIGRSSYPHTIQLMGKE